MKTLMTMTLLFSSTLFAACPDLSGAMKMCRSTSGQTQNRENQTVTQSTENGLTTYHFSYDEAYDSFEEDFIADGKPRRDVQVDPDTGISLLTATTAKCEDDKLLIHSTMFVDGQFLGMLDKEITKSGNQLTTVIEGMLWGRDVDDLLVCE